MRLEMDSKELYSVLDAANDYREEGLVNLTDNGMLMRVHEHSNTALYAGFIPSSAMDEWDPGKDDAVGMHFDDIIEFLPKKNKTCHLAIPEGQTGARKIVLHVGDREYKIPLISKDSVAGVPEQVPELDHAIHFRADWERISSFIAEYQKMRSTKGAGAFYMSARDGILYLWAQYDDYEIVDRIHWEDLDDVSIDWSSAQYNERSPVDPAEDHALDCLMSVGYTSACNISTDEVDIFIDNHYPMKIVSERENGVKQSWMIPPRIPQEDEALTAPERIIKDRSVLG